MNALAGIMGLWPGVAAAIVAGILPRELAIQYARLEPWGFGILMLLILAPFVTGGAFSLFDIIGPFVDFFLNLFVGDAVGGRGLT